ncbi:alpha/beta fold hydrolase [Marinomonas spartinae]|uniref:alpha/beta fold hydrolase n=1 Tax=Marinomonas spartinae TaxID=1792290 RepID=UPI0018F2718B|nr:alpha/beta hydrolase [Marinomonas spartinae]MBJ7552808.1 alpha/beta hydrolase [Marinomonas spartinae]
MSYLFLPGLLCDAAVWQSVLSQFPRDEVSVVDYGDADSIEAMAKVVLQSAPECFVLVGHSMGGLVALEVYRQAPERVSHLVLLDTGYKALPKDHKGEQEKASLLAFLALAKEKGMAAMGRQLLAEMVHPDRLKDDPLVTSILAMMERQTLATFTAQVNALVQRPDATCVLREVACPVLLMCGRQDSWTPVSLHEAMLLLVPDGELHVIEESGHVTSMEQPQAVVSQLQAWLALNQANKERESLI